MPTCPKPINAFMKRWTRKYGETVNSPQTLEVLIVRRCAMLPRHEYGHNLVQPLVENIS